MWVVAGVLLGLVVVALLVGFHSGPHAHIVAAVIGLLALAWLLLMAVDGRSAPVLWALASADLVVSAGVGLLAWHGLVSPGPSRPLHVKSTAGAEGVAVSDLIPEGIVRVRGEQWSAVSVNGTVRAGTRIQVLSASGVRLDVWGEDPEVIPVWTPSLDRGKIKERNT